MASANVECMTATFETALDDLAANLRLPVAQVLAERADEIRRALPPRPQPGAARYVWLRSLTPEQARHAALWAHLDALYGHLRGRPALGYGKDDVLPEAVLQEAEGFDVQLSHEIAHYRAERDRAGATGRPREWARHGPAGASHRVRAI